MPILKSAQPCPALRSYVRAYAYRKFDSTDLTVVESVPSQLEQVLNFEFGILPGVWHHKANLSTHAWIGEAQIEFPGYMELFPGVESFAIFFQPSGWSQLFHIPMFEVTNQIHEAESVLGHKMNELWNRLVEESSFDGRVDLVENLLLKALCGATTGNRIMAAVTYVFQHHGAASIQGLSDRHNLCLRQFERLFRRETGASPKSFARVARFQAALDAKITNPKKSWLEIAHSFGYYDQMHMIHDFEQLGRSAPQSLILQMGDVRPPALASAD